MDHFGFSFDEKAKVWCDSQEKSLITSAVDENFPFPFILQSLFLSSFVSRKALSNNSNVKQHVSIFRATVYLKKKLRISETNQIDFTSRFRAFHPLPNHLRTWESTFLGNFSGTVQGMAQQGH